MEHDGDGGEQPGFFASRANIVLVGFLVLGDENAGAPSERQSSSHQH